MTGHRPGSAGDVPVADCTPGSAAGPAIVEVLP
jgi:hypothetical protein